MTVFFCLLALETCSYSSLLRCIQIDTRVLKSSATTESASFGLIYITRNTQKQSQSYRQSHQTRSSVADKGERDSGEWKHIEIYTDIDTYLRENPCRNPKRSKFSKEIRRI